MCSIVSADLKSVGRLAIVELGLPSFLATSFGPLVQAVESLPPPIRGLGKPDASVAATAAAAARVLIVRVARNGTLLLFD